MGKTVSVPEIEAALRQFDDDLDKARQGKITFFDVRLPGGKKLGSVSQDDMKHLGELLMGRRKGNKVKLKIATNAITYKIVGIQRSA